MQTTIFEVASDMQAAYPECISESKSSNRIQALTWGIIAVVLFVIYSRQPDKDTTLGIIQLVLIITCGVLAIIKLFSSSKLTHTPTGSAVSKQTYCFNLMLKADIIHCLEEGNTARLKALKNDDAGGLLVELLESKDKAFIAARLLKYEPHGYVAITRWHTMKA